MRLEQLTYLVSIVRCRSFNKAAKELFVTQPTISKAIEALEAELDCKLFLRGKRGTVPTEEGLRIYEDACEIFKTIDSWRDARAFTPESAGTVHLVGTSTFCDFLSNGFLLELQERFPHLELILHDGKRGEIAEQMLARDYKLGVVSLLSVQDSDPRETSLFASVSQRHAWEAKLLLKDPRAVFISSRNPLASQPSVSLSDLKTLALAGYSDLRDEMFAAYHRCFRPDRFYQLHNRGSIFRFVAEDRAATIFPTITTSNDHFIEDGLIRPIHVDGLVLPESRFFLLHPGRRGLRPAERVVMDALIHFCGTLRPPESIPRNPSQI